jgi:hypothetical protein
VLSHLHLSYDFYGAWWYSALGFILVLFFGYLTWGRAFFYVGGLKIPRNRIMRTVLMALAVTGISLGSILLIASANHVVLRAGSFQSYVHDVFYILNEEIIIGALMLYFLTSRFRFKPLAASVGLALFVAVAHFVFYKWDFRDKGYLDISTLATLFLTAVLKNNLIICYRHIGYAWAIHFGWMVVMFGSEHYRMPGNVRMTDLDKFNLYLGSPAILIASLLLALASIYYCFPLVKQRFRAMRLLKART